MQTFGWIALFFGAFFDALIGPNLIIPGEPFFIAAGYQLHQGVYTGVIAVLIAGGLGDQLSFFIGKHYGIKAQRRLIGWQPRLNRHFARARWLMRQNGNKVMLLARLLGPVAWVVPFIAGAQKVSWERFTRYASIGLLLGVGQFIFWGYALAMGIQHIAWLHQAKHYVLAHNSLLLFLAGGLLALLIWRIRRQP